MKNVNTAIDGLVARAQAEATAKDYSFMEDDGTVYAYHSIDGLWQHLAMDDAYLSVHGHLL